MTQAKSLQYKVEISPSTYDELIQGDYLKNRIDLGDDPFVAIFDWYQRVKIEIHGLIPEIRRASFKLSKKTLEDLLILDKYDIDVVLRCINLSFTDTFWKNNIFSIATFRKPCKDGISRFTKILMILNSQKKTEKPSEVKFGRIKLL